LGREQLLDLYDISFNTGLINHFANLKANVYLQIRGRKYTPLFTFKVGNFDLEVKSVQTEVDAGYEGEHIILLLEAKIPGRTRVLPSVAGHLPGSLARKGDKGVPRSGLHRNA
jgi:hypothetical protein